MKALSLEKQKILPSKDYIFHKPKIYIDIMPNITYISHKNKCLGGPW